MKGELLSKLDTKKKKVAVAVLCGGLMTSIGIGTAFAANSIHSFQVKIENGVQSYSTDSGKSWSEKAPDGVTVRDEDGKLTISNGTPPKDAIGKGSLTKVENGVTTYSTDNSKTWSTTAPDDAEESMTIGN